IVLGSRIINQHIDARPGTIITSLPGLVVATAKGLLELLKIKPAGSSWLTGKDFRNGFHPQSGEKFGEAQ
ncbi:MAG: hypothetical protein ACUVUR_06025, partial [bacterium]